MICIHLINVKLRLLEYKRIRYIYLRQIALILKGVNYVREHFEYDEMEGDHIIPWSKGGKSTQENCQMLCKRCNREKSGK